MSGFKLIKNKRFKIGSTTADVDFNIVPSGSAIIEGEFAADAENPPKKLMVIGDSFHLSR